MEPYRKKRKTPFHSDWTVHQDEDFLLNMRKPLKEFDILYSDSKLMVYPFQEKWCDYHSQLTIVFPSDILLADLNLIVFDYLNFSRMGCYWCGDGRTIDCYRCYRCKVTMCESCFSKHLTEEFAKLRCEYCKESMYCHAPFFGATLCSYCYFQANDQIRSSRLRLFPYHVARGNVGISK